MPSQIGRYRIRKELGRGMMGVVYEVYDPALGRTVALKTIRLGSAGSPAEREEYERRFVAEARIAARLSHPGIVVVHDVGRDEEQGMLYIALEHLEGRTLAQMTTEGRPDWRETLRIVARVAEALDYAHAQRVVHRDIKPANIMVLASGRPKIMDFGIAKFEAGHHTATGQFFGTPLFMSPEQAQGQPVDGRTDQFSLGSVAYTLLTGRPPFEAANVPGILARVTYQEPTPPSEVVAGLPREVEQLLARAMAKSPDDRYPSAGMLADDIEDVLAGRDPRHCAGMTIPSRGERTVVSRPLETADVQELELVAEGAPPRPRRRRPAAGLVATLFVVVAAYFYLRPSAWRYWRERLAALPQASTVATIVGRLSAHVGALREPDPDAPFPARVGSAPSPAAFLILEQRRGVVQQAVTLDPGPHEVRVQVSWDKNVKSSRISGTFASDVTRRLDVSVGGPRGDLRLAWR